MRAVSGSMLQCRLNFCVSWPQWTTKDGSLLGSSSRQSNQLTKSFKTWFSETEASESFLDNIILKKSNEQKDDKKLVQWRSDSRHLAWWLETPRGYWLDSRGCYESAGGSTESRLDCFKHRRMDPVMKCFYPVSDLLVAIILWYDKDCLFESSTKYSLVSKTRFSYHSK